MHVVNGIIVLSTLNLNLNDYFFLYWTTILYVLINKNIIIMKLVVLTPYLSNTNI